MEQVILVNTKDEPTGTMDKMEAHRKALLHRAFSVFIFNKKGEMLLQQRALKKYHSAGLWSNACCGHPRPNEDVLQAAQRRLSEELGIKTALTKAFDFIYKTEFENGLTEYEFDHVFTGYCDEKISPEENEVKDFCFKTLPEIETSLQSHPSKYTEWFHIAFPQIIKERKLQR
jgi:isopentenyl-diphosphate Delta-isomerase